MEQSPSSSSEQRGTVGASCQTGNRTISPGLSASHLSVSQNISKIFFFKYIKYFLDLTIFSFAGVAMQYVTAVLFLVEARIQARKEIARENVEKQQYPMERTV